MHELRNTCTSVPNDIDEHRRSSSLSCFNECFAVITGPDLLYKLSTMLFNCMLIHGLSTNELLVGTMIPLQKDKRNTKHNSVHYRALTMST